jgi:hypothetical protein
MLLQLPGCGPHPFSQVRAHYRTGTGRVPAASCRLLRVCIIHGCCTVCCTYNVRCCSAPSPTHSAACRHMRHLHAACLLACAATTHATQPSEPCTVHLSLMQPTRLQHTLRRSSHTSQQQALHQEGCSHWKSCPVAPFMLHPATVCKRQLSQTMASRATCQYHHRLPPYQLRRPSARPTPYASALSTGNHQSHKAAP